MSWAKQEFETIELGDRLLNQLAVLLAEQKPGASFLGHARTERRRMIRTILH